MLQAAWHTAGINDLHSCYKWNLRRSAGLGSRYPGVRNHWNAVRGRRKRRTTGGRLGRSTGHASLSESLQTALAEENTVRSAGDVSGEAREPPAKDLAQALPAR